LSFDSKITFAEKLRCLNVRLLVLTSTFLIGSFIAPNTIKKAAADHCSSIDITCPRSHRTGSPIKVDPPPDSTGSECQSLECQGRVRPPVLVRGNALVSGGGKCLDVHAPDMRNNGAKVQVWDCNNQPQQQWSFRGNALVNGGGKCLDVHAPDMRNNGAKVQVWDCNNQPQQQWSFRGNALVNGGGKCLDVHAPDMRNNGAKVQVWDCNNQPQQQWRF
jgi:predicted secreted protein